ncbi:MAG: hypothetical protein AABZ39_02500 [Spirochaetota bacterium]
MDDQRKAGIMFLGPRDIYAEIEHVLTAMRMEGSVEAVRAVYNDTRRIFSGDHEEYKASNTGYHDFAHTENVFLAALRLIHGVHIGTRLIDERGARLALIASLLHDIGFIQEKNDNDGTGAKYGAHHEKRSMRFTERYLTANGYSEEDIASCAKMIACTMLGLAPSAINFSSPMIQSAGFIVGSADLIGQLADRLYLEKLLLLYREVRESGTTVFTSEFDLLKKTENFYRKVAAQRLTADFGNKTEHLHLHFRERWGIDENLYAGYIEKNIAYLHSILERDAEHYRDYLRRGGIVDELGEP